MQVQVIRTDEDHRAALAQIEALWGAPDGTEDGDRLEALVALVESYEARRWPLAVDPPFDPVDALHFAMEELGHTRAELTQILGSRSRVSETLSRRRALTVQMIHVISQAWKLPAELLVRPYRTGTAA
ncbi:MAG TPA: transcriptional regulator [Roseiarcus sp.]|nr:transcriptional regulator [Roseiarcus sp.]